MHVTAAHHISGFSAPAPVSLPYYGATRRVASRRGWIRVEGAYGIIGGSRRAREDRGKTESSNGRRAERKRTGAGGGRYVSTGYAGTLTPPDYPMNRNVIYGSFNELEGWRESRADRAIAYNTSRHVASPRTEIDPFARAYYTGLHFYVQYHYYAIAFITQMYSPFT